MQLLNKYKPIIGMVHIKALPGTPNNKLTVNNIIQSAINEATIYVNNGVDCIMIENMHDVPYLKSEVGHEISTLMAIIAYEIKKHFKIPLGIQILAGANQAALASAFCSGADFIRAEGFVFGHIADEGFIESNAAELLRYRKKIGAQNIKIFTDIKKKHSSHSITQDVDIIETAKAAEFFLSDGVIITGTSTGEEVNLEELKSVKLKTNIPVIIGSGVTYQNIDSYYEHADAFIVGSSFKLQGNWFNDIDAEQVNSFMEKVNILRISNK